MGPTPSQIANSNTSKLTLVPEIEKKINALQVCKICLKIIYPLAPGFIVGFCVGIIQHMICFYFQCNN